jgi:hypothetical protein
MARTRRRFQRRPPDLDYRKLFLIATEGAKTEPVYFNMFNSQKTTVHVKLLPAKKHDSSPNRVLKRAQKHVKERGLRKDDEVWLVIDRDQWTDDQLNEVFSECRTFGYSLAVSNPKFEYWLLLHFEAGKGVSSPQDCSRRLQRYLPNFEKGHVEIRKLFPGISNAIRHAKAKDTPLCREWPRTNGSTVYRLVEKLYILMTHEMLVCDP